MIHALIVTHGLLGAELLRLVESLLGPQQGVHIISNEDRDLEKLCDLVASHVTKDEDAILFVDFCGGSPYVACRTVCRNARNLAIISGVNLPMLTSFFAKRGKMDFAQLTQTVRDDGLRGIQLVSENNSDSHKNSDHSTRSVNSF